MIFCASVEAWARLVAEVTMAADASSWIDVAQRAQHYLKGALLSFSSGISRRAIWSQPALVAYADGAIVVTFRMSTRHGQRTAAVQCAILADVVVITNVTPAVMLDVQRAELLQSEVLIAARSCAMDDDVFYLHDYDVN